MKFSENWLRSRLPLQVDQATLLERFDMIGHEVESVERLGEGLDGVVVAQIISCARHPQADRLQVCEVDAGSERLQIVCGAPNARAGLKAPLAKIGARVGEITIKAAKLRGVDSNGMLCSARELGLDADASGLLELPLDAVVGQPLAAHLGLPDAVIDLGLTPNRADCLSVEGLAIDVAAAFDLPHVPLAIEPVPTHDGRLLAVELESAADCPRYCGRFIAGIDMQARSPAWLVERLRRSGLRPISLLVDVTNYVMLELGQPLHAFDADTLQGPIGVRRGRTGETLKLLDEREVELDAELLVITDAGRPVALAGLMGGFDTRVTSATRNVFLEAAHFAPTALAGRARRLGMHTDAAHRFERGVDAALPRLALDRATALILEAAGGAAGAIVEAIEAAHLPQRPAVPLRRARIVRLLGISLADGEIERIFAALDMCVERMVDGWRVTPPGRRFDIAIEEDLIEELARIHGYDRIPDHAPGGALATPALPEDRVSRVALREQLVARGFHEAITYAFVAPGQLADWQLADGAIALANPLSADLAVMRTSLLPGLAAALVGNRRRQAQRVRLFEIGRVFSNSSGAPLEAEKLAGIVCGTAAAEQWGEPSREVDFFDLKGDVESLLALTNECAAFSFVPAAAPWAHPGQCAAIERAGQVVGHLAALHPQVCRALDLDGMVLAFELDVVAISARAIPRARALSRFPSVRRDLSFELPAGVPFATVEAAIRDAVGETLADVVLFDRYVGEKLGGEVKSLAIGLILQDCYRTLTDEDADRCTSLAVAALQSVCGARLRG